MSEKEDPTDKPEDLQESAWALFRKSAELRKQANELSLRAHDLLEKGKRVNAPPTKGEVKEPT